MADEQKTSKKELAFQKAKVSNILSQVKDLKLSAEEKKDLREVLKRRAKDVKYVSVKLRLKEEEVLLLKAYVELAQEEKKAHHNERVAKSEIVSFALVKFMKADKYFQAKLREKMIREIEEEEIKEQEQHEQEMKDRLPESEAKIEQLHKKWLEKKDKKK